MKVKVSKKWICIACTSLVLALLVTFLFHWLAEGKTGSASSYLAVAFEGIGKGLDPKGGHFDINKVKSDAVLKAAIEKSGLEDSLSIEELRKLVVISPLADANALGELTKISSTEGKTQTVIEKAINTGDFMITVKEKGFLPNPVSSKKLSAALMASYKAYLKDVYLADANLYSAYDKETIFKLDYPEMMMVMEHEADALLRYTDNFAETSPNFISKATGLTFMDLSAQAEAIRDMEIGSAADIVDYYALTENQEERISYENTLLKRENLIFTKAKGKENRRAYILGIYDNTANYIVTADNLSSTAGDQENLFYGELMDGLVAAKNVSIAAQYQMKETQKRIDKLATGPITEDKLELTKRAVSEAEKAYGRMEALRKQVRSLAEENYDLNIGSKINVSRSAYRINAYGNLIVNFAIMLFLTVAISKAYTHLRAKGKEQIKEIVSDRILQLRCACGEKLHSKLNRE